MNILLVGMLGKMGQSIINISKEIDDITIVAGISKNIVNNKYDIPCYESFDEVVEDFDVIIDFSNHLLTYDLINFSINKNKKLVIATTGQNDIEKKYINDASQKIPIFFSSNYSIGITLLIDLAKKVSKTLKDSDIEIVETHHNQKLDAPSGTALSIAENLKTVNKNLNFVIGRNGNKKREKNDIGINSIRRGNVVGIHEVIVSNEYETIILKHEAHTRYVFAKGAIEAAKFIFYKNKGLYNMNDMINY